MKNSLILAFIFTFSFFVGLTIGIAYTGYRGFASGEDHDFSFLDVIVFTIDVLIGKL